MCKNNVLHIYNRSMGFLVSSQAFDGSYFKNILLSPLFLVVYGLLFALFVLVSYRIYVKKREEDSFVRSTKPPTPCSIIFYKISRVWFLLNLLIIIITSAYFHSGRFLTVISDRVNNAWEFRNNVLHDMKMVNLMLHDEALDSVCQQGVCDTHPFDPIFDTMDLIIATFEDVPSPDIITNAENIFAGVVKYSEIGHAIGYVVIVMGIFFCFVASYVSPKTIYDHRCLYLVLPICVGFLLLLFSSFFYVAGIVISDTCKNTSDIVYQVTTDDTFNFYYNCDPNKNHSFPKIITSESDYTKHFQSTTNDDLIKLGCNINNKIAEVKQKFFFLEKKNITCCKGCNATLLDDVLDIIGNDDDMTGLWKNVSCAPAHNKLRSTANALCDFFPPVFSNFILYLTLAFHVIFAF